MRKYALLLAVLIASGCGAEGLFTASAPPRSSAAPAAATPAATPAPKLWRPTNAPAGAPSGYDWIAINSFDGSVIVAAVQPSGGAGVSPVLVFLHPSGGLRPRHLAFAAKFPKEGYLTVTPCWQRYVDPKDTEPFACSAEAPDRNSATDLVKDVMAIVDAARTLPGARGDRVALVGHSAGAGAGILTASMGGKIDAVVAISGPYGPAIRQIWGTTLADQLDGLAVPLLIVHGTNDTQTPGTNIAVVRAYQNAALDRGKNVEALYVEGAPHLLPYLPEFWTADVQAKVIAFVQKRLIG